MTHYPTVFIVEDDHSFLQSLSEFLHIFEVEVVGSATTPTKALDALHTLSPDVILCDINMPEMDGFDLAARIAHEGGAPCLLMTAGYHARHLHRLPAPGVIDVIDKLNFVDELLPMLAALSVA